MSGAGAGEGNEARILAIALKHVRRDGIGRLTVVRVAEEAGMTHANVYRYFASKAALGERIVSDWLRGIEQRLSDITQAPDPAPDKLERFLTFLSRAYEDKAAADPQVFTIFADAAEAEEAVASRHRQRIRELLRRVLEEGIAGHVFTGDVRRIERLVLDVMHRFLDPHSVRRSARRRDGRAASMDTRRDRMMRVLMRGLSQIRA
jgi:AcrR family transcriptional regulator